jgi:hypothetical protein
MYIIINECKHVNEVDDFFSSSFTCTRRIHVLVGVGTDTDDFEIDCAAVDGDDRCSRNNRDHNSTPHGDEDRVELPMDAYQHATEGIHQSYRVQDTELQGRTDYDSVVGVSYLLHRLLRPSQDQQGSFHYACQLHVHNTAFLLQ